MLDFLVTVFLFAFGNVIFGKYQIIDNRTGIGPGLKQIIAFKKGIVAVTGMSHYQGLHGNGIFFHQVSNTRIGINHYFVGQAHLTAAVLLLVLNKFFAK